MEKRILACTYIFKTENKDNLQQYKHILQYEGN